MNIEHNYYQWGPFLYKTKLSDKEIETTISFCIKDKKLDHRKNLAGHIDNEYLLNNENVFKILLPYIKDYLKTRHQHTDIGFNGKIEIESSWVNYMKQGEFNPPHVHTGDLSCVLYLQIPKDMGKNIETHVATSPAPGSIYFCYGESLKGNICGHTFFPKEGEFFIFPSWLHHYVYPFKSDGERVSLSANFNLIEEK